MKFLQKSILLLWLLAALPLFAQIGEIHGTVYNFTEDSAVVKNIAVQFVKYRGHELLDDSSLVTETNNLGQFRVANLPLDSTLIFYPRVTFHSIVYYGSGAQLSAQNPSLENNVVVFDTTADARQIAFQMEHIFLEVEADRIEVREIYLVANAGKKTYLGKKTPYSNRDFVLEFPLPEKFEDLEILTPEAQTSVFIENNSLYETALLSPGTRQFSYRVQVPYAGKKWLYSRDVIYPSFGVNIFLVQPELAIDGPGIRPMGDFFIKEKTYQHYSIQHLMPGEKLEFTLTNLPAKTFPVQLIVLIAVAVLALLGFTYTFLKKPSMAKID